MTVVCSAHDLRAMRLHIYQVLERKRVNVVCCATRVQHLQMNKYAPIQWKLLSNMEMEKEKESDL